jgi:uncharacterized protein (DUF885 family)
MPWRTAIALLEAQLPITTADAGLCRVEGGDEAYAYALRPSEVDRYVVYAGQACSYMVGQLRIVALRDRARAALVPRFSVADFHEVILSLGSVPLGIMESEVERWIERTR